MAHQVILVVDEETEQRLTCEAVLRREGYHVLHACDGAEAIGIARQLRPDLVLLHVELPDPGAAATLGEFRGLSRDEAAVPVVAMTSDPAAYPRRRVVGLGFDGCVSRACAAGELLAEVRRLIGPATVTTN